MEYTSQLPENKLKRELSLETAKISGVDTIEQLESKKRIDPDLPTEAPGEINPESLEMDVTPEGYDFQERLKQEPIPPRNFLPDEINRKILIKFYDLFKILYELSSGDVITSFTMANIILLGSKFISDLINNLLRQLIKRTEEKMQESKEVRKLLNLPNTVHNQTKLTNYFKNGNKQKEA